MRFKALLSCVALAWAATPTAVRSAGPARLNAQITVDGQAPTSRLPVVLTPAQGEPHPLRTDRTGALWTALPAGEYRVEIEVEPGCLQVLPGPLSLAADQVLRAEWDVASCARTVLTREYLQRVPSGRSYQQSTQLAAGVVVGPPHGGNPNIGGAASDETSYLGRSPAPRGPSVAPALPAEHRPAIGGSTLVERDPLSTFAIDVDTASFSYARGALDAGLLPDPGSVRVEEFVNAQRYRDPPPDGEAPFTANVELAPDPVQSGRHLMRIGVRGANPPSERPPVQLTFLIDTSGSMQGPGRLDLAVASLHELVRGLSPTDEVALVTYAGDTRVALGPTPIARAEQIHAALDGLRSGGGTAMGSGMELAYALADRPAAPGVERRVIVLSDGDANIGATSHEQILSSIAEYAGRGITLTTVGFGRDNYRDALMEQLADLGDGACHYIDGIEEARRVFGEDLLGTLLTVARDVKIQVEFDPASVISYRLLGYENRAVADEDFRADAVDAGEMGYGHTVTALYELVLRDRPGDTLATLRLRSKPPGEDRPATERTVRLPAAIARPSFEAASADFRVAWAAAAFAEILRGSPAVGELTLAEVAAVVRGARRFEADDRLAQMIERADDLRRGPGILADGR